MSSIPVVVLGIKRANFKALQTKNHFKKMGFKNVSIYYGLDIKKSNPDNIKKSQITSYNQMKILEENKDKPQLIIAEDDARITKQKELMIHLKKGIKGVDRLIWNYKKFQNNPKKKHTQNTGLVGYSNKGIKKVLEQDWKYGFYDQLLSQKTNEKVSGPFGFEYIYEKGSGTLHGDDNIFQRSFQLSRMLDKGETDIPLSFKRYSGKDKIKKKAGRDEGIF
tara:strand:+ start:148 stop:810 length:663 start_codon:yes stop_codon:yes gene_type:complete